MGSPNNRSNDGITVNKVSVIAIAMAFNTAAFFYISDRGEFKTFMKEISVSMNKLVVRDIVRENALINIDHRMDRQDEKISTLVDESRVYWQRGRD